MNKHTEKAIRSTIQIAEIVLEVFKLSDGNFALSQTQTTNAVKKPEYSIRDFYSSKRGKALLAKGLTSGILFTSDTAAGFVKSVPIEVAYRFWLKEVAAGNEHAEAILAALVAETLERKCQVAFNQVVDEEAIAQKAVAAYRETLFGYLNNAEYIELAAECRADHAANSLGW